MEIVFKTPLGDLILIARNGELIYCNWDTPDCEKKRIRIINSFPLITNSRDKSVLETSVTQLQEYFRGERKEFELPISFKGTTFQNKVWSELLQIPYGSTISYRDLVAGIGSHKSFRAAAGACGNNPLAIIIPCHRVISASGNLGGYTGGIDKKISLLGIERQGLPFKGEL